MRPSCGTRRSAMSSSASSLMRVHPEPRRESFSGRFEMDVGGAGVVGLADQEVHEPDDGRLVGEVAGVGELVVA